MAAAVAYIPRGAALTQGPIGPTVCYSMISIYVGSGAHLLCHHWAELRGN